MPTDLRHDHLLTSAHLTFLTNGFEGTSMQRVAERAGVTKPVLYAFFGSKEELFAAVIDRIGEEMSERLQVATDDPTASRLGPGIRSYLADIQEHGTLLGPMLSPTHHSAVAEAVRRLQHRQVELIVDSLRRGHRAAGLEPDDREVEALAHLVMGAVHSVGRWWGHHPEITLDEAAAFLEAALAPTLVALRSVTRDASWFAAPDPAAG